MADVAKRDSAAIERCHLRQCHLTLDQVTSQWNGSTWGEASLSNWRLSEILQVSLASGRQKSFHYKAASIFWPMFGTRQVAELEEGWARRLTAWEISIPSPTNSKRFTQEFPPSIFRKCSQCGHDKYRANNLNTHKKMKRSMWGKLAPCPYISATCREQFHLRISSQSLL